MDRLRPVCHLLGNEPATGACGPGTEPAAGDLLVPGWRPNLLSHTVGAAGARILVSELVFSSPSFCLLLWNPTAARAAWLWGRGSRRSSRAGPAAAAAGAAGGAAALPRGPEAAQGAASGLLPESQVGGTGSTPRPLESPLRSLIFPFLSDPSLLCFASCSGSGAPRPEPCEKWRARRTPDPAPAPPWGPTPRDSPEPAGMPFFL